MSRRGILATGLWLAVSAFALAGLAVPACGKRLLLDSQPQGCLPWHVYWRGGRSNDVPPAGSLVVFDTPKMRAIDPRDAYSKLKMVAAVPGQTVSVHDDALWIDGRYWGRFWIAPWIVQRHIAVSAPWFSDGHAVSGTWIVPPGEVLLLGTEPYSFDGRYWGFLRASQIGVRASVL